VPSTSSGNGAPDAVPDGARIGAQLKAARLAARKSMTEVAEQAGLTKGFVSKLERDLANVSVASLIRLCDALGVPGQHGAHLLCASGGRPHPGALDSLARPARHAGQPPPAVPKHSIVG
jgi:transcriptional regulator with XRE-family HTH domain